MITWGELAGLDLYGEDELYHDVLGVVGESNVAMLRDFFPPAFMVGLIRGVATCPLTPDGLLTGLLDAIDAQLVTQLGDRDAGDFATAHEMMEALLAPWRGQPISALMATTAFDEAMGEALCDISEQIALHLPPQWPMSVTLDVLRLALERGIPLLDIVRDDVVFTFVDAEHDGDPLVAFDTHREPLIDDLAAVAAKATDAGADGAVVLDEVVACLRAGYNRVALAAAITNADVLAHLYDDRTAARTRYGQLVKRWQRDRVGDIPLAETRQGIVMHSITRTYRHFHAHLEPVPDEVNRHAGAHALVGIGHVERNAVWAALLLAQIVNLRLDQTR